VVVFVAIVGTSVGSCGGGGTLKSPLPVGAPKGYRFGSAEPAGAAEAVPVDGAADAAIEAAGDAGAAVGVADAAADGVVDAAIEAEADAAVEGDAALPAVGTSHREAAAMRAAPPESTTRVRTFELKDISMLLVGEAVVHRWSP
jgi:hypothetical protein